MDKVCLSGGSLAVHAVDFVVILLNDVVMLSNFSILYLLNFKTKIILR